MSEPTTPHRQKSSLVLQLYKALDVAIAVLKKINNKQSLAAVTKIEMLIRNGSPESEEAVDRAWERNRWL